MFAWLLVGLTRTELWFTLTAARKGKHPCIPDVKEVGPFSSVSDSRPEYEI